MNHKIHLLEHPNVSSNKSGAIPNDLYLVICVIDQRQALGTTSAQAIHANSG